MAAITPLPPPTTATSYTLSEGSSSGATGVATVLTLAPVGGVWPSVAITIAVSGVSYTLSNGSGGSLAGSVLTVPAGTTTSCTVSLTPSTVGTATISATNSGSLSNPGNLTYSAVSSAATSFSTALSPTTVTVGQSATLTVTPVGGSWPASTPVSVQHSGVSGFWDNTSLQGSGTTALLFTFTATSAGTATITASATGMTTSPANRSLTVNAAVVASGQANRYDLLASASSGDTATARTISALPTNGTWPSGSITLTAYKTGGGSVSAGSLSMPGSGSTPLTVSWTPPSTGEWIIKGTNSASLANPYGAPYNCFAASAGTAQTLALSLATGDDQNVFQYDHPTVSAAGFSIGNCSGEVWFTVTALGGASGALYVQLYDGLSVGASATPGTGTALHGSPVQVYGALSATGEIRLIMPGIKDTLVYADFATDSSMTNRVRCAKRFRVGMVLGVSTRSFFCNIGRGYDTYGNSDTGVAYDQATVAISTNPAYPGPSDTNNIGTGTYRMGPTTWYPDGRPYGEASTAGGQEFGRLTSQQFNKNLLIAGIPYIGGGLDGYMNPDGTLHDNFTGTLANTTRGKFRWLVGGWEGFDGQTETIALYQQYYTAFAGRVLSDFPTCAVVGVNCNNVGGDSDDSRDLGFARQALVWRTLEPSNPHIVNVCPVGGYDRPGASHPSQSMRLHMWRTVFFQMLTCESTAFGGALGTTLGPTLATSATISSGTRQIVLPFKLNGGSALHANLSLADQTTHTGLTYQIDAATSTDLTTIFAVYAGSGRAGSGSALALASVTVDNSTKPNGYDGVILLNLAVSVTPPSTMMIQAFSDYGVSGTATTNGRFVTLCDDVDPLGIGIGRSMRPTLDIPVTTV